MDFGVSGGIQEESKGRFIRWLRMEAALFAANNTNFAFVQ
jgi:hypothetical protein